MAINLERPTLPISFEAERAVLVALLINKRAIPDILSAVVPDDFVESSHKLIFRIVAMLFEKQQDIDMVSVSSEYRKRNTMKSRLLVSDLFKDQFTGGYRDHVRILKDLSYRRRVFAIGEEMMEHISGEDPIDQTVSEAIDQLAQAAGQMPKQAQPMEKVVSLSQKRVELAIERKTHLIGIPTGYYDYDTLLGGLYPGELVIVGARPSIGKSALLAGIAVQAARRGFSSLIVNAEMTLTDVGTRMLARETHIENYDLRRGKVTQEDITKIITASASLSLLPIWIYDDRRWGPIKTQMVARKRQMPNLAIVLIDFLTLIHAQLEKNEQRYQQIGRICREAKELAQDLNVCVVMAAQISRVVAKEDKEPELVDLRESGDIEQNADVVTFLHRFKKTESENVYWLIKKNRNGPLGFVKLRYVDRDVAFYGWNGEPEEAVE